MADRAVQRRRPPRPPKPVEPPEIQRAVSGGIHAIGHKAHDLGMRYDRIEVSADRPPVEAHRNAHFVPPYDALYDEAGRIIPASRPDFTEAGDIVGLWAKPPETIDLAQHAFAQVDDPVIFAGSLSPAWGHFLTDDVQRLWLACEAPDAGRLFFAREVDLAGGWARDLLALGGMDLDRRVRPDRPLRFRSLALPYPSFQAFTKVYRRHDAIFGRMLASAQAGPGFRAGAGDYYVSRRKLPDTQRKILNEDEIEELMHRAGYRVVYPERMTIAEQIGLFNTTGRVVGFIGSALHSTLFSFSGIKLGVLCTAPGNMRCYMIDRLKGYPSWYFGVSRRDYSLKPRRSVRRSLFDERADIAWATECLEEGGFI